MKQIFFLGKSLDSLVKGKRPGKVLGSMYIHTSILSLKKTPPDPSDSCKQSL